MKKIFLFLSIMLNALEDERLFEKAGALYRKKEYEMALTHYNMIEHKTAPVWYNMALVAEQLQQDPVLYLLRAKSLAGASLFQKSSDRLKKLGYGPYGWWPFIKHWLVWYAKLLPLFAWQCIFLLVWYILCWVLMQKNKRVRALAVLSFFCFFPSLALAVLYTKKNKALVIKETALYNGPHRSLYVLDQLKDKELLSVDVCTDDWCKVIRDETKGWVPMDAIALVEQPLP